MSEAGGGPVAWSEMRRVFGRIGLLSFGGPAAQIALMHRTLVDERRWLGEAEYLRALSFCMLLPGPEAMQLATYAGWKLRGIPGGLLAGLLFIGPGAAVILALAALYAGFGQLPGAAGLFLGIKACVVVIVIEALQRVAKRALKGPAQWWIAVAALAALYAFSVPFPVIIAAAALVGAALWRGAPGTAAPLAPNPTLVPVLLAGLALWALPVALAAAAGSVFLASLGLFFSKLAVVTFGGAYAVLSYMTQEIVRDYGWVTTAQMMDALGLAETTPGPLILVTEFVGYLAGHRIGGAALGVAAALLVLWVTFVPCFLWIFAFAPYVEWIATRPRLAAALQGVTAAVVGVIANLALWFALHVFFRAQVHLAAGPLDILVPDLMTLDWRVALIAVAAGIALLRHHANLFAVLGVSALAGLVLNLPG